MKLLNHTTAYFATILLVIISVWAGIFYYNMLDEIYDSMDDGLENQKILVMQKAAQDTTVLLQHDFEDGYYLIRESPQGKAHKFKDKYVDTLMSVQNEKGLEPYRMLRTMFLHQGKYYELRLITSMVEEDDLIEDLLYSLLWLYLGLVASILVLNNFLLKRIWRPFYRLLDKLQRFRLDRPEPFQPEATSIDEFQLLNQTAQKLLQSNVEVYEQQKQFIENASHELQTPVAISLNKLELLAGAAEFTPEQGQMLESALQQLERLTRLNKSLLLLSKIENRQFKDESKVNIGEMLRQLLQDFAEQLDYKELQVHFQEEAPCQPLMNQDLASILLLNLLKNAINHNVKGGSIDIKLDSDTLTLENSGPPSTLDASQLFGRFQKGSSSTSSTGLGLAIVQAICRLYGFTVAYEYKTLHTFNVRF